VPDPRWEHWLKKLTLFPKNQWSDVKLNYRLKVPVGKRKTLMSARRLWVYDSDIEFTHPYLAPSGPDGPPTGKTKEESDALRLEQLRKDLRAAPEFQKTYGFPKYERADFDDPDHFIDGHTWEFDVVEDKDAPGERWLLTSYGVRWVYTLLIPVSEPNPGNKPHVGTRLPVNFTPPTGAVPAKQLPEVDGPHYRVV